MATEISRTFDRGRGMVTIAVKDSFGEVSSHAIYVAKVPDVDARIAQLLTDTETQAEVIHERLVAAGWKP